jgi:phospholipase/carboxylesterase
MIAFDHTSNAKLTSDACEIDDSDLTSSGGRTQTHVSVNPNLCGPKRYSSLSRKGMRHRMVLLFHGLGGDRNTMSPIGDYCARHLANTQFHAVEGPANLGSDCAPLFGWFVPPDDDKRSLDGPNAPKLNGLEDSVALVHKKIGELVDQGQDPLTIHLLGHSQGGAIALAAGLTYSTRLGSVCTIAGYLALTSDMHPTATGTRYFLHHSEHDDNVGVQWAHYAKSFVERTGESCNLRCWDIYSEPHSIHVQQLDSICAAINDA